jgi:hypothetical protein
MYGVGRRIWNPKDEGTWEHDLFNELTINESLRDDVNTFFFLLDKLHLCP